MLHVFLYTFMVFLCSYNRAAGKLDYCGLGQIQLQFISIRAVPDFSFASGRNPALFPNPAEIRLRQKSHRSRIILPDLISRFFPDI